MSTAEARQTAILRALKLSESVSVADLSRSLMTSEVTIRRDLGELESIGVLRRTRGGAVSTMLRGDELPYAMRTVEASDEKTRIAAAAVGLLADGEAVILDSGTTAAAAVPGIASRRLTVMPLGINAIADLASADHVSLILPGGTVRPGELSVTGPMVERNLADLRFDSMLLTCCGFDLGHGVTAYDLADAAVKRAAMGVSSRVIAMIDSTKFARTAMAVVCPSSAIDVVVTDAAAPPTVVDTLRASGIEVLCV